jgi:hypothetical protein
MDSLKDWESDESLVDWVKDTFVLEYQVRLYTSCNGLLDEDAPETNKRIRKAFEETLSDAGYEFRVMEVKGYEKELLGPRCIKYSVLIRIWSKIFFRL